MKDTAIISEANNKDTGTLTFSHNVSGVSYAGGSLVTIESDQSALLNNIEQVQIDVCNVKAEVKSVSSAKIEFLAPLINSQYITGLDMLKNTSSPLIESYNSTFYADSHENLHRLLSDDLSQ